MKRLTLNREALTALTTDEMAAIAGGNSHDCGPQPTPPIFAPQTLQPKNCLATSQDSVLICSGDCITFAASCRC